MRNLPFTFTQVHPNGTSDVYIEDVVPFYPNVVISNCPDFASFEETLRKAMASPHWHPLSNTILYYHVKGHEDIPKIFMIFWFYKIINGIIVQFDDSSEKLIVSYYNPYVGENFKLSHNYGCWKKTKVVKPVHNFDEDFICEEDCHNVTIHSQLRKLYLGTCIGYETVSVEYGDVDSLKQQNFFEDKSKNLHGFSMLTHGVEVVPFLAITINSNGTYTLGSRDGMVWRTASELMNFTINLDSVKHKIKKEFDFNTNIQDVYTFSKRQADVVIFPVYQFDLIIVEVDLSIAYKDSGVCVLAHRAGFDTVLFNGKLFKENTQFLVRFALAFIFIWLLFFTFNTFESGKFSLDQAGKDLVNTFRNILSISLHKPPRRETFRIYLSISIWSFFVINFATQAVIVSFFTAYKRGKEVDTFEDIIEKGYVIEGMASPDMMLPDEEERFVKINSKLVSLTNLYGCVDKMLNDSRRFCLMDCSIARYLERNALNQKGEQYLHVAKDQIHSHYLTMVLQKHSPLTKTFNRHLRKAFEGGLITKWEQYRFSDMKDEVPIKALSFEDLRRIFEIFSLLLGFSTMVFLVEIVAGAIKRISRYVTKKIAKRKLIRMAKKKLKKERNLGHLGTVNAFTN
ncbi:hypothetical protein NE865_12095 [Phthorimaea operculella]|nr:hypothetical protein NE865_12095 [Phthorimaea operculella]